MQNFLAKCVILAFLAGGFAFTGDATRVLRRGRGILDATTIPNATPAPSAQEPPRAAPDAGLNEAASGLPGPSLLAPSQAPADAASVPTEQAAELAEQPAPRPSDAPVGAPVSMSIPAGGPQAVDVPGLSAGDRVTVWIGTATGRGRATMVAFDIVDPATGDAVELRHASGGANQATLAPFRRVRIAGNVAPGLLGPGPVEPGRIVSRRSLCLEAPRGSEPARTGAVRETTGPVVAIAVAPAGTVSVKPSAPAPGGTPKPAPAGAAPGDRPAA